MFAKQLWVFIWKLNIYYNPVIYTTFWYKNKSFIRKEKNISITYCLILKKKRKEQNIKTLALEKSSSELFSEREQKLIKRENVGKMTQYYTIILDS